MYALKWLEVHWNKSSLFVGSFRTWRIDPGDRGSFLRKLLHDLLELCHDFRKYSALRRSGTNNIREVSDSGTYVSTGFAKHMDNAIENRNVCRDRSQTQWWRCLVHAEVGNLGWKYLAFRSCSSEPARRSVSLRAADHIKKFNSGMASIPQCQ